MLEKYGFDVPLVNGLKDGDPFLDHRFKDIAISIQVRFVLLLIVQYKAIYSTGLTINS